LAVSCGDDDPRRLQSDTEELLARLNLDLPTYTDPTGATRDAFRQVAGRTGFPTNFVLDRRGVIRAVWVGYGPGLENEMKSTVRRLLREQETEPRPRS
jgi:hypothetical protein